MPLRIMASRHSAFYTPLLCCVHFLRKGGIEVDYSVLKAGQRSHVLIGTGEIDIMQSAVSSNWNAREKGVEPLPVHFAQINTRDGFFLVGREAEAAFDWHQLEGRTLLADHGHQPLVMLKYAFQYNGVDWAKVRVIDRGAPGQMEAAFRAGEGDFVHLQAPVTAGVVAASVGASMPAVAFSSLCCSPQFQSTKAYQEFRQAYGEARAWARTEPSEEVADVVAPFFPEVAREYVRDAIERYQHLGCWEGGIEIPRGLYEQALNVFEAAGAIRSRHPYEAVVG